MRELKFRAWNKEEKRFLPTNDLNFVIHPYEDSVFNAGTHNTPIDEWVWDCAEDPTDELIIMQYTGLKDKNGKEIYEGDIVKWMGGEYMPIIVDEFHSYRFLVGKDFLTKGWAMSSEVVGNIYKNPELIDTSKCEHCKDLCAGTDWEVCPYCGRELI